MCVGLVRDAVNFGFDEAVRIKSDYIAGPIRAAVSNLGLTTDSIVFQYGAILLWVHSHTKDGECWVSVTVDVWVQYSLVFGQAAPNVWYINGTQIGWRYKYDIENCWPKCGDIEDDVKKTIKEKLDAAKRQSIKFADLNSIATSSAISVEPYGLVISIRSL